MSNPKCFKCAKTVYATEMLKLSDKITLHKACSMCSKCGVRLTLASAKVHETKGLFCQRDWDSEGLGTVGVAGKAGNDDIQISSAKRAEAVRRDATSSGSKEVQGKNAGQDHNTQALDMRDSTAANAERVRRDATMHSTKEVAGAAANQQSNSQAFSGQ